MDDVIARFADEPPVAVTFDFWDTLVRSDLTGTRAARRDAVLGALASSGHAVAPEELDTALADAGRDYAEHWHANRQYTAEQGAAFVVRALSLDDPDVVDAVVDAFVRAAVGTDHVITDNIATTLGALSEADVRIGIICDVGMTPATVLRTYLEAHDLLGWFDHWSFSDEVGVYKPDPVIFRHALDGLGGVAAERAVHIGDLNRTDIVGALGVGMAAVRYAGVNDDGHPMLEGGAEADPGELAESADAVITDHAELPGLLGLG